MNYTQAITTYTEREGLVGKNSGCPILYVRDEDNLDVVAPIKTYEFFEWLKKYHVVDHPQAYCNTAFYMTWFATDDNNGEDHSYNGIYKLQDVWTLEDMCSNSEYLIMSSGEQIAWVLMQMGLNYIYEASFGVKIDTTYSSTIEDKREKIRDTYHQIKSKYGSKVTKETFIQAVRGYLQRTKEFPFTVNLKNVNYITDKLTDVLSEDE